MILTLAAPPQSCSTLKGGRSGGGPAAWPGHQQHAEPGMRKRMQVKHNHNRTRSRLWETVQPWWH